MVRLNGGQPTPNRCAMTLFEYLTIAVSIVLSFGLVRLLDGLRPAVSPRRAYWVHAVWVVIKLLNLVLFWWALWNYREGVNWNLFLFAWVLLPPALLYLQATALVTRSPDAVPDWQFHFYEIRQWFFAINVLLVTVTAIGTWMIGGVPLLHPLRGVQGILVGASVCGMLSTSHRVHAVIVMISLVTVLMGFGAVLFQAGALRAG